MPLEALSLIKAVSSAHPLAVQALVREPNTTRYMLALALAAFASATTLRLDAALVTRGLCSNRAQAKTAVQAGLVLVNGKIIKKASFALLDDADVVMEGGAETQLRYVSRAGDKLRAALGEFNVAADGANILDVGASTGGFTDCLLDAGAASAVCVDCGHDQLAASLVADDRVVSLEGVNARTLTADQLPRSEFDLVVVDVSFISLRLVLPAIWPLLDELSPSARLIALVKPQFEAGKEAVSKGKGMVKDAATQERALDGLVTFAREELPGCAVVGTMASPILGGDGQKEFLMALAHGKHGVPEGRSFYATSKSKSSGEGGGGAAAAASDASAVGDDDMWGSFLGEGVAAPAAPLAVHAADDDVSGLVPVKVTRPTTAASRSSKFAKKKEIDSLKSGRERAGKTDGPAKARGSRGRKNKQHRQDRSAFDD